VREIAGGGHLRHLSHPRELAALLSRVVSRHQNRHPAEA
jgi:hypothetical protein